MSDSLLTIHINGHLKLVQFERCVYLPIQVYTVGTNSSLLYMECHISRYGSPCYSPLYVEIQTT